MRRTLAVCSHTLNALLTYESNRIMNKLGDRGQRSATTTNSHHGASQDLEKILLMVRNAATALEP
jgi:hypothetical protein